MPVATREEFKQRVRGKLLTATALINPIFAVPIGPVIPNDMIRRIARVSMLNAGVPQLVELYLGLAVVPVPVGRILQDFFASPALLNNVWGNGDPGTPLFVCRPTTTLAPPQNVQIWGLGLIPLAPFVDVTIEYWDERW